MSDLLFEMKDGIATITLNRPDSRNSFSLSMLEQWIKALERVRDDDEIRVLVLTGAGKSFCAGGDVKAMINGKGMVYTTDDQEKDFVSTGLKRKNFLWKIIQRIPLIMEEIDKPTIAAINGDATGAGLDMALQCDLRFASEQARFGEGYINVGIVPGDGGGYLLPRIIGVDKALELFWTGRLIGAEEAEKFGLVTRIVADKDLMKEVNVLAHQLAKQPQQSIRLIKRTVYQGLRTDLRTSLDTVSSFMALVTEHPDFREALNAIYEKRQPNFE